MEPSEIAEFVYDSESSPYARNSVGAEELNQKRLRNLSPKVVVTDVTDADGLGCGVLYTHEFNEVSVLFAGHNSPEQPEVLETVCKVFSAADESVEDVFITDLGQNGHNAHHWKTIVDDFATLDIDVHFRDHHQTPPGLKQSLSDRENVDYKWAPDKDKCATELVWEHDVNSKPDRLKELVELTSIIDLRKTESDKFERARELKDASEWLGIPEYISSAIENGASFTEHGEIGTYLSKRRELRDKKIQYVVNRAETVTVNDINIGLAVGDCYQTRVAEKLFENYPHLEIVAIIKPTGKVSFRSTQGTTLAKELAVELGGGGHATEAGSHYEGEPNTPTAPEAKEWILEGVQNL